DDGSTGNGECRVFLYESHLSEAAHLAGLIEGWVVGDGVDPRDVCVLTRKRDTNYTDTLKSELAKRAIMSRVESDLQDLLAEPLTIALLDFFKLGCMPRAPASWAATMHLLQSIGGEDSDMSSRAIERRLSVFLATLRPAMAAGQDEDRIGELVERIMSFVGEAAFILQNQHYGQ